VPIFIHAIPQRRRVLVRRLGVAGLALLAFPVLELLRVTAGPNFHEVTPGRLYRSAQLSASELRTVAHRFGIKSIINLRNACPHEPWYQDEASVTTELGIRHYNLSFSAYLTPAPQELRKLVAALETCPRPVLIHCRRGADRTGLATSIAWLHDHPEHSEATKSLLALRFGHVPLGKVKVLDRVYGEYWDWLRTECAEHSRSRLKQWVNDIYRPGADWAKIEPLVLPETLPLGKPAFAKFRVHNLSHQPWQFYPSSNLGFHLRGYIEPEGAVPPPDSAPFTPPRERRRITAGLLHATVAPGTFIDLEVTIPAMPKVGRHIVFVDLFDEANKCFFNMVGSTPYQTVLETTGGDVAGN
jgi:protein tyrosine phosphatase (PTP) superfamily phosphohydrolase (DUF442 family)